MCPYMRFCGCRLPCSTIIAQEKSYYYKNLIPFVEESGVKWGMEHF
jgi:hypothetical protein